MSQRRKNGNGNGHAKVNGERKLGLSSDEARILLDACRMFRHSLPVYLLSSKPDLKLINRVIRKLS